MVDMISSEESGVEDDKNYVKQLPWRAPLVKSFVDDLDDEYLFSRSVQAKRQTKVRELSSELS